MSEGMAKLKNLAMDMGDEIGRQNDQLDRINVKTDRALPRLENQNKQMKKILYKWRSVLKSKGQTAEDEYDKDVDTFINNNFFIVYQRTFLSEVLPWSRCRFKL